MKLLFLIALALASISLHAKDLTAASQSVFVRGHEVVLPSDCELTDSENTFICTDNFGNEDLIGFKEGDGFEATVGMNYHQDVFDRVVLRVDYGYFVQYTAKKSGRQYNFVYLKKEKVLFFGGDVKTIYQLAMQTLSLLKGN